MKRYAPAAERNRESIAVVLTEELPASGLVLKIASGTGEHAVHFARTYPHLSWQPSDPDADARHSIAVWREQAGLPNFLPPIAVDAAKADWPVPDADALVCIDMVHISPPASAEGLLAGTGRLLPAGAPLVLYGPYLEEWAETAPSNLAFDQSLKARDPRCRLATAAAVGSATHLHRVLRCRGSVA